MEEYTSRKNIGFDEDIILSAEKKITVEPIHDDVHLDDESDAQIAASHANGSPIGNISGDRESTATEDTQPSPEATTPATIVPKPVAMQTKPRVSYRSIIILSLIVIALLFALLYR